MAACPNCGAENPEHARFCSSCGSALAGTAAPSRIRKTVTIVFSDIVGSTELGERFDPETVRGVMSRYFGEMRAVLERHGGAVEKFIGDAVMAVFGIPKLHEDDAMRAVRAADEMRRALEQLNDEFESRWGTRLAIRIGVNTGEVVTGDPAVGQTLVTGDAVNLAARLEQAASAGEIVIGPITYSLIRDAATTEAIEPLSVKGKADRIAAHRLIDIRKDASARRARGVPLIGRDPELAQLREFAERVWRGSSCELVTILGSPGIGKSRLTAEFLAGVDRGVVRARCLPYGEGITFWPAAEAIKQAAGILDEDDAEGVGAKIGRLIAGDPEQAAIMNGVAEILGVGGLGVATHELFWAVRKVFEAVARPAGLALVFEDIHWAEPTFLDMLEYLKARVAAPLLIVCPARPELLEERPSWVEVGPRIALEALPENAAGDLVTILLGEAAIAGNVAGRMVAIAEGNPLFLEELVGMLVDQGVLRRENGSWALAGDPAELKMPATIEGILAARLDQLQDEERTVIGCGSVIGRTFEEEEVRHLAGDQLRDALVPSLDALERRDLIQPDPSTTAPSYRFRHILIRDAAYAAVTKESRAALHERFARWLEASLGDRAIELEEIVGYHFEQAFRWSSELGPVGSAGMELAGRATEYLARAGRRALARSDMPAASRLLARAVALSPDRGSRHVELLVDLAAAQTEGGEFDAAEASINNAEAVAPGSDARLGALVALERWRRQVMVQPEEAMKAYRKSEDLVRIFEVSGDDAALAKVWKLVADNHLFGMMTRHAEEALMRALDYARRAGDRRAFLDAAIWLLLVAVEGHVPTSEAFKRLHALNDDLREDRFARGLLSIFESLLHARRGDFITARQQYRDGRALVDDAGRTVLGATYSYFAAKVEMLAGDPEAAVAHLQPDYDILSKLGERTYLSTLASASALALHACGRYDEAEALAEISRETGGAEDAVTQMEWRRAKAQLLAARGDLDGAEELIREALAIVDASHAINDQADTRVDAASIFIRGGRRDDARTMLRAALALYEEKENVVSAARARAALQELETA
ncbi:MAG: adenylate/guanylate cyclase domain-containing protein [Actinomycetota bacterium]